MTMGKWWMALAFAPVAAIGIIAAGCGTAPKFAPEPVVDAGLPPPPPPVVDAGPPAAATGPCDPVQTLALTTTLQGRATTEAPGMKPDGAPLCGVVPEAQPVTGPMFMLEQGYCYTFLAQSLPPVTEVDMSLEIDLSGGMALAPNLAAMANRPLLVDTETGEKGAMASKGNCYVWPWPIPAQVKLIVRSKAGAGPVAAQVYKKKK
jgi:hypothetical protein